MTKAPAVASNEPTSPPVRGSDFGFAVTARTATVDDGKTVPDSTPATEVDDVGELEDDELDDDELDDDELDDEDDVGVHEQAVDEMVVVVVAILADEVHGLGTVVASGVTVTALPLGAAVSLTSRS
jgi:hypothetical protein